MAQYSTAEAKKEFFLTSDDLHDLPKQSIYCGFGTGAPMKVYDENDLEEAAVSKHGREGLAKKRAAREKRESNKRKREEEAAAAIDPAVAERNMKIVGPTWDLQITSPESVAGTKAELVFGCLPPTGWPGESTIDCNDYSSPASSFGNIHGFKGKSSESDSEMKFVTKWKRGGRRYTGTLSVQVKPSDMDDRKPSSKSDDVKRHLTKENVENSSQTAKDESPLMVVGRFDTGINDGVRSWSFKGYRKHAA